MAKPIEATPRLRGGDARRLAASLATCAAPDEIDRRRARSADRLAAADAVALRPRWVLPRELVTAARAGGVLAFGAGLRGADALAAALCQAREHGLTIDTGAGDYARAYLSALASEQVLYWKLIDDAHAIAPYVDWPPGAAYAEQKDRYAARLLRDLFAIYALYRR